MKLAPIGAFALLSSALVEFITIQGVGLSSMLGSIGGYFILVVVGLAIHTFIVYPIILKFIAKKPIIDFYKQQNSLHQINGLAKIDQIFEEIRAIIASLEA